MEANVEDTISRENKTDRSATYQDAGVNIDAGNKLISMIASDVDRTARSGADTKLGGFGALFDLKGAGFSDPVLVAATDGVGTKLEIAREAECYRGLGIDLVAMCANDILAQGAAPLFFLDYFATGNLDIAVAAEIIKGIADGCEQAGCALIGGETAEMPGVYPPGGFDLAGFCVGAAERGALLNRSMPQEGDVALAIASTGIHANGFSLVRHILEKQKLSPASPAPFDSGGTIGDSLLTPTAIYASSVIPLLQENLLTSIAHITGGGLIENPHRVFADHLSLTIDLASWQLPKVFLWMMETGNIPIMEMLRTFNCGVGMIVTTPLDHAEHTLELLCQTSYQAWRIGHIEKRNGGEAVRFINEGAW